MSSTPVRTRLGARRRFISAIVLFVALDLTVLIINLWLAEEMARDAVAINLAGRQRMLSQQATKALLLANTTSDPAELDAARQELHAALGLLAQTLGAFARGGETPGGDGEPVVLKPVTGEAARVVGEAQAIVTPLHLMLRTAESAPPHGPRYGPAARYMVMHNRELLALMNRLTTTLEHDSVRRSRDLRAIQSGAFLLALANFIAIVVDALRKFRAAESDNRRWREMARRDPLTGLANRKAFTETAQAVLARAAMDGGNGAVLMLDLDGFKPINDSFGHASGDRILAALAGCLELTARATDTPARLGGDEFAILCPKLHDPAHIEHFCSRLLAAIARLPDDICPGSPLAASIGVAIYPDKGYDLEGLLAHADRAMYAVKTKGGNLWQLA